MNHKKAFMVIPGAGKDGSDIVATRIQAEAILNVARDCSVQTSTAGMEEHKENSGRGCIQFWHEVFDRETNAGAVGMAFQRRILVPGEKQPELNQEFITGRQQNPS